MAGRDQYRIANRRAMLKAISWDWVEMAKWPWRSRSMTPTFNTNHYHTQTNQFSLKSESKWPNGPWRSRSMPPIFNTSRDYPRMHVWNEFGDSSPNLWWVIAPTTQISRNSKSKWPNDLEGQGQWPPFSIPAERIPICIFGANLVMVRTK